MQMDLWIERGAAGDLGIGLFLDGRDDDGEPVGARGVEEEKGKAAVAGDEAEFIDGSGPPVGSRWLRGMEVRKVCGRWSRRPI